MDSARYGTAPAPPPLSAGSLPSQRLSTQIPQYNVAEAPACVQNAMMTKDKKPFTYTPGGIDLSQIKSQRMAKRLARNAQNEGTTGQQQMHRPTQPPSQQQQHSNGGSSPGVVASQLGATAMGMPFQVLPTGPPPPPPQPGKVGAGAPPPPPPAPQQNKLAPQSNGNAAARRSPTPQKFEPPPMGFRPEIKIPPNPMASLKKVPPPQEKNNFWMEEYRKERSKSPMVGNDENDNNRSSPNNPEPETNQYSYSNSNNSNQQNDPQPQYRAPQSPQPMRQQQQQQQQENYNQTRPSPPRTPVQQQQQLDQQRRNESPYQTQYSSQQSPTIQRQYQQQNSPQQQSANIQRQISQQYSPQPQQQQQQSPTMQRQPSQQYQNTPQHSPQVQRQQSIPMQSQQQQQQYNSPQQSPSIQRQQTYQQQSPTSPQYQQQQQQQQQNSPTQQQSVPWRQQKQVPLTAQNNVTRPRDVMSPAPAESPKPQFLNQQQQQQQQQYPAYLRSREGLSPAPEQHSSQMSQPYQQKNAQVGSIYIPPVVNQQQQQQFSPYQDAQGPRQQQQQQQAPRQAPTNRWMNAQGQTVENQTFNRIKSPPPPQSLPSVGNSSNGFGGNNTGLRLQINNNNSTSSNPKERIIPIQLEQTPTPTRTPASAPGFGPQPFYNSAQQQQYSSVPSPPVNQGTPNNGSNSPNYVIRSPNQFVDQGYNQYTGVQDHPTRVTSPQQQQQQQSRIIQQTSNAGGVTTRIIPIAIESQPDGPLNSNNARGPISQQPIVIQNDPRNQNTWGSGSATPTQSKSFRILQKITDTSDDSAFDKKAIESDGGQEQEPQLQRPTYARQMSSTGQINSPNVEQMKRMQLNNEQVYANRARNQEDDKKLASEEDPRYRGPSNPSKTFQKLQGAIERCSPCRTDANGTPPVMKQPQPNRYVSQRPVYSPDEHSQQYVHPSEQQVPEPKIYTGSAIPSRSFKILQAMTTPENAAESDSSDVVETDTSISECPCQQQQQHQPPPSCPYSYPYLPPCCTPPPPPSNSSSGGDVSNWQYPYHHHPHSHHPHHHHHHHHPCSHHHPHPHQHPAYPYPPPCPCYFYNYPPNDYDSQNCSNRSSRSSISSRGSSFSRGRSQSQDLPKITITPSTDDVPKEINGEQMSRSQREGSVIDILLQKLSEISKPEGDTTNTLDNDKNYVGEKAKALEKSPTPTKSESENDKVSSDDSAEEMSSESEPSSSLSSDECPEERSNEGLKAIRSVSNIQFYNKKSRADSEDDDRTIAGDESMVFDEEEEEEIIGEELEYDGEEVLVEEIDSEECEEEEEQEVIYGEDEIIIMDDLSVIYEENESDLISPRPSSRMSSSVSETSTLANEEEVDHEHDINESDVAFKKEDDEEDNSNSVTVRLPLKFSFSRSSNDENIATVEVGNSEVEDRSRSFSIASVEAEPEDYESDSQDCDVSVTISLSRSSDSVDKKLLSGSSLSHISAEVIKEEPKEESVWESDDEDVSVSFSLPMRNKFMDQTLSGDLTNNISMGNEGVNKIDEEWRICNGELEMEEKKSQTNLSRTTSDDKSDEEETETEREGESSIDIQDDNDEEEDEETEAKSEEELDFWETLQATRREAQMFLEKTAGYWGKSVDGKIKPDPTATDTKPIEEEKDEDFWSNIRVKKEEPKPKAPKLKKKKKVIKKVVKKIPEPEPEPEVKLTIVKLPPNINNKSKVVESAIQMIQEKTKKPKKLVKQVSKEEVKVVKAALENEIVQITKAVEEEKKLIEEAKTRRASLSMAKSIDEPKIEEVKKEEIEDRMSKYVREKAELKTQILNQKFAKAFVIPNKPPLMKGVLSEAECEDPIQTMQVKSESSISTYCEKSKAIVTETAISTENIKIEERKNSIPKVLISHEMETAVSTNVIEEPKKLIKKKITKAKAIDEDCDGNTLKPPAKKTVKKSTSTKKIKKKKEDIVIDVANTEGSKENENKSVLSAKITSEVVEEKTEVVVQEETTVVMQKPSSALEGVSGEEKDFWAEIEISKSSDNLRKTQEAEKVKETDPWASVQVSKESEDVTAATTQETDPWIGIESISGSENLPQTKSVDEEPDFWAVIDAAKTKIEQSTLVESSKIKTQQKVTPKDLQLLQWCNVESFATTQVKITEVVAPKLMNGCRDYWLQEIEKPVVKKEESPKEDISLEIEKEKSKQEELKPKKTVKKSTSTTDTTTSDASSAKPEIKRRTSLTPQEDTSSSQTGESVKLKTVRKSSITKEVDSTEFKPKTKKKTSTPEEESTFPVKPKKKSKSYDSGENGEKRSSIKLKSKKKLSEAQPEKETSKSTKACSLKAYSDYDIELVHGEPEPVFYPICSQLDTGISFWATVSYTKEEEQVNEQEIDIWAEREAEGNSEIDTGKIDFWVTQRKFQTTINLNGDNAPKNIEESGEDFWADIQDNPVEDKTPEKIEEVDFWANNWKLNNFVENNYPMKTQNQANDADYRANNRKSDNVVETPAMVQNQAEEVDFWANNRNTDNFVENNYPMKTHNQANGVDYRANNRRSDNIVETPAMIQNQVEEVDFWVKNRNTDNFVEPRNTMKTQDQSRNVHNWVNSRNNDNFVENRSPVSIQDQPDNILVNNLNRNTAYTQVQAEKRDNFGNNRWADNLVQNRLLQENQANEVDFWANNRNTDTFAGTSIPVKDEEPAQEVDFWAEIKGQNEEPAEDDCELRRNNYKKAMAFFTNTVSVEKKEKPEKKFVPLTDEEPPSRPWRPSVEPEWIAPNEQNEVALTVEDTETTEDEPETLVENTFYILDDTRNYQQNNDEEESQSSESMSDSTPNHFQIEYLYPKPEPEAFKPKEKTIESVFNQAAEDSKISVKDRIFAFETGTVEPTAQQTATKIAKTSLSVEDASPNLSRNSSQRSESEIEEDDSGVTDMNKPLSETDTESESFPELRKMTPYQRASTHSRLFKLLQDDEDIIAEERPGEGEDALEAEFNFKPRKKIVHNVSITRKQNPNALQEAETVSQRRQRLSLPLRKNQSIDADNPSTPNSPASPIQGQQSQPISDKLVNELIQSLLLKKSSSSLKNLPMEKLQAAAKRVLEEELDSLDNTSLDSTPALTPQEFKNESYADYYDTWNSSKIDSDSLPATNGSFEILPSKAFKVLQETAGPGQSDL